MTPDLQGIYQQLDAKLREADYKGWDPFDGLNSRIFQATPLAKSRWMRLAWLQFFKRSPVNFRKVMLVSKVENAKAIALLTRSYLQQGDRKAADYCLDRLLALRSPVQEWGDAAWGYPFDWQAKAFFVPKGTPNVICTLYAVLALEAAEDKKLVGNASPYVQAAGEFVLEHLLRKNEQGCYIAYIPGSEALVYNASLWGAYVLLSAYRHTNQSRFKLAALPVIENALQAQGEQGEWRYGTMPHHQFIDGFHTGYNLEALARCNAILKDPRIDAAIAKGLEYYLQHFVNEAGQAGYYQNNPYPIDPHSAAQLVMTLDVIHSSLPESQGDSRAISSPQIEDYLRISSDEIARNSGNDGMLDLNALQKKILQHVCSNLWDEKAGYFHYQQHRHYRNRCQYLRWTQAWMHLALSTYLAGEET